MIVLSAINIVRNCCVLNSRLLAQKVLLSHPLSNDLVLGKSIKVEWLLVLFVSFSDFYLFGET